MKNLRRIVVLLSLLLLRIAPAEEPLTIEMVQQWTRLPPAMIEGTVSITSTEQLELDFRAFYDAESEAILLSDKSGTVLMHYHPDFGGSHIWIKGRPDFFAEDQDRLKDPLSMFRPLVHFRYLAHHIENVEGRSITIAAGTTTSGTITINSTPYSFRHGIYVIEHIVRDRAITSAQTTPPRPTIPALERAFSDFDPAIPWLPRKIRITRQLANAPPEYTIEATITSASAAGSSEAALGELTSGLTQFWPPEIPPSSGTTPAFRTAVTWITRSLAAALVLIAALLYWHRRRHPV